MLRSTASYCELASHIVIEILYSSSRLHCRQDRHCQVLTLAAALLHCASTRTHSSADDLDDSIADRGRSSGSGFASGSDGEGEGLGMYALSLISYF
jgi:hypothetical protein